MKYMKPDLSQSKETGDTTCISMFDKLTEHCLFYSILRHVRYNSHDGTSPRIRKCFRDTASW